MLPELRRQNLEFKEPEGTIPERKELCGEKVPEILILVGYRKKLF